MAVTALFLYGTLRYIPLLETVLGYAPDQSQLTQAKLPNATVSWVQDQHFPMIELGTDRFADGLRVTGLNAEDMARLNFYEGGFDYSLQQVETSQGPAQVYVPGADVGPAGAPFSLKDWIVQFGKANIYAAQEAMMYYGARSAADVAALTPRIRARAYSRIRAEQNVPTEFDGNVVLDAVDIRYSDFWAVRGHQLRIQTFAGPMSAQMDRAVFWASDAALLLPYDPVRDTVMVIEQARVGPLARGDRRVWYLEPVGGAVDAGETPEAAAIRETKEETGLDVMRLEAVCEGYSSPGTSTEVYYCYVGLVDLPNDTGTISGLAEEDEDIRTHVVPFDTFMEMIDSNRICIIPLIMLGHWLARNRDRLRAQAGLT